MPQHFPSVPSESPVSYSPVMSELRAASGILAECQCLPGFTRNIDALQSSLRGLLDQKVVQILVPMFRQKTHKLTLCFFGSGKLLNELTIVASLMRCGFSLRIFLIDKAYNTNKRIYPFDNSRELAALHQFLETVYHLSETFHVTRDIRVCTDFADAVKTSVRSGYEISAFFMLDAYFPTSRGLEVFQSEFAHLLPQIAAPHFSYQTVFFFLNKKNPGPMRLPVLKPALRPPTQGFDPAVLNIYHAQMNSKGIAKTDLIFTFTM